MKTEPKPTPIAPECCPILERTGDGRMVGRCWFHTRRANGRARCPRHGDVENEVHKYATTGELTDEAKRSKPC